ncbi:MAG TPA: M14 family zinc carboxypeptidase [Pseudomonadota bacterium]|nr:M14 family zinc carboxypeptidase [Pseudomonadota bacterium]
MTKFTRGPLAPTLAVLAWSLATSPPALAGPAGQRPANLASFATPATPATQATPAKLATVGEQSGYVRTGRYDEVVRLCAEFARAFPNQVRCQRFGTTPGGRPMLALVASADGVLSAEAARQAGRPVVLAQGGIHAGEIDGKDAGFLLLGQLLGGRAPAALKGVLGQLTWVFVPVFNVDGHERFGPYQRPNQDGPTESGWRTTAQNLNLNRDYAKAEAPEMQAMLQLLREWDPLLYVDLHVTDGADFQPEVAVEVEPRLAGPAGLRAIGGELNARCVKRLGDAGILALDFYPSFRKQDDPTSGFAADLAPARFSTGYWPLRNRFAMLVEAHSWKPYPRRVRTMVAVLSTMLAEVAAQGKGWLAAAQAADVDDQKLGGAALPLRHEAGGPPTRLRFPGYHYTVEPSPVSGALRVRYDPRRPEIWDVPFYGQITPQAVVSAPRAGYLIPPELAELVGRKLSAHDLKFRALPAAVPPSTAQVFRVSARTFRPEPYEGRQTVQVEGRWQEEKVPLLSGALYVPVAQRGGRLAVQLLEPTGPDSLLAWGFFNSIFEQKEYMEDYVAESIAEQQLAADPRLRSEFLGKLREPGFARDPAQRLRFFYERHPSFDGQQNRYPIYRLDREPPEQRAHRGLSGPPS